MNHSLALTENQHEKLFRHLCTEDQKENAAVILCHHGRGSSGFRLIAHKFIFIPAEACEMRTGAHVSWPFAACFPPERIEEIDKKKLSIVTIHSHPNGCDDFSSTDDKNDRELFRSVCNWFDDGRPNGSSIMLPSGKIIARLVNARGRFSSIRSVSVVGQNIQIWNRGATPKHTIGAGVKIHQTFGKGTFDCLRSMHVGVVGCSGTGSIITELLARNCIGHLTIIDPDCVEEKNLNRIINATHNDTKKQEPKVAVLQRAVRRMGTGVKVESAQARISEPSILEMLVECDVLFGCVDSAEGRYQLECIASAYFLPYFDVGVNLEADAEGGITQADAVAHYMHPGNAGLMARGSYTSEQLTAENWHRTNPEYYEQQRMAGYLAEVGEDQPAVISINMQAACMAFNDFLARVHGFRLDDNEEFSEQRFRVVHGYCETKAAEAVESSLFDKYAGMGDASFLIQQLKRNADRN